MTTERSVQVEVAAMGGSRFADFVEALNVGGDSGVVTVNRWAYTQGSSYQRDGESGSQREGESMTFKMRDGSEYGVCVSRKNGVFRVGLSGTTTDEFGKLGDDDHRGEKVGKRALELLGALASERAAIASTFPNDRIGDFFGDALDYVESEQGQYSGQ